MSGIIPGLCPSCKTFYCWAEFGSFLFSQLNRARVAPFPFIGKRPLRNKLLIHPVNKFNCQTQIKIINAMLPGVIKRFQLHRMDMFKVRPHYFVEWKHIQAELELACYANG
jgi:hypothetical protein